jgi:uncharacterized membrane protein (DUF2068 family)
MRPLGVTAIAVLTWLRGAMYALGGLALIGIVHLSSRLIAAAASDTFLENLIARLGKALGIGALLVAVLYIVVGFGLWELKNWARMLTLIFVALWFLVGLIGLVRHPTSWHVVRAVVDVVILAYLMLPNVKRLFATA